VKNMTRQTFVDRLSDILVKADVVSEQEARVYKEQFEKSDADAFEYFLYDEGLVSKEDLLNALSRYYQVPAVDVEGYFFDHELLLNFPKDFLLRNEIIPLELDEDGNFLIIAAARPDDETLVSKIGIYSSSDVQFQVGLALDIDDAIKEFYDKAVTEVPEDIDLDTERREKQEFERDGQIREDED